MGNALVWLAILAGGAALTWLWLATPLPGIAVFTFRLLRAQQTASRFYAECPWVIKNIAYHPDTPRRLDVYRPASGSGYPVVIYVYGGSWRSGNKELYSPAAQRLLPHGLVLAIPDYTLHPRAGYPRQTEEIAAAVAWTLDHIDEYGGDPKRVVVVAQSAGAQISGLALLEPKWLAAHAHSAADVRGFIGISGVYDFGAVLAHYSVSRRARRMLEDILGGEQNAAAASPITHVSRQAPPTLLIHGDADKTVPLDVGLQFHRRLVAAGVPSELVAYAGAGHGDILFRALTEQPPRLFDDIVNFVRACTAVPGGAAASLETADQSNASV